MGKNLNRIIKDLPEKRRVKIEARAKQLIAEELTLSDVRKARKLTQMKMAKLLNIGQDSVSRIEKRSDMLLSTLESYVRAMGGNLSLVAKFPDRPDVTLKGVGLDELFALAKAKKTKKNGSRHRSN